MTALKSGLPVAVRQLFSFCREILHSFPSGGLSEESSEKFYGLLRADVCKYRPEAGKIKFLKNPPKNNVHSPRYSSNENINFSFIAWINILAIRQMSTSGD